MNHFYEDDKTAVSNSRSLAHIIQVKKIKLHCKVVVRFSPFILSEGDKVVIS